MLPLLKGSIERWSERLTTAYPDRGTARLFFRGLVLFTLIKIVGTWSVTTTMVKHHTPGLSKVWLAKVILAPAFFAYQHPAVFLGTAFVCLVGILVMRPRYFSTLLLFWIALNLYALNLPIANGSDVVMVMMCLWIIPMVEVKKNEDAITSLTITQRISFNLGVVFCKIQIVCLYFVSGWDKLLNIHWRTGDALIYIQRLELLYNPILPDIFTGTTANFILAWLTIIFELSFAVLIWKEKTRLIMLLIGTVFHVFIWIVLSLPDFAGIMILSYVIFLKDKDFQTVKVLRVIRSLL